MTENALPAYRESLMPTIVHPTGGRSRLRSLSPAGHASGAAFIYCAMQVNWGEKALPKR